MSSRFPIRLPLRAFGALTLLTVLAGCGSIRGWAPTFIQPYRPDVQQGNVITQEMVDQLRDGMTRDQVRFLLGTPMLTSVFHQDRWDYVFFLKRGRGTEVQLRRLVVYFKDNRLAKYAADPMPPEAQADNLILGRDAARARPRSAPLRPSDPGQNPPGPIF